ncbi:MAG: hypothetical protein U0324_29850 [Polyangiales bacterium]
MRDPREARRAEAPPVDTHVVTPESREELLRGQRIYAAPSQPEHGDPHFRLDVALGTHTRPGYVGSTDLLTRVADDGDFATDTCVRREGIDPATGQRYLEELAFEVVNTQRLSEVTAKAEELTARGVRRIYAVFARKGTVAEWRDGAWETLADDAHIDDACLAAPLPVAALVRASALGASAVRGLLARGEPELQRLLSESEARGEARGESRGGVHARRASLRAVLDARGVALTAEDDARIAACEDGATLDGWLVRAATATARGQVFG